MPKGQGALAFSLPDGISVGLNLRFMERPTSRMRN